MFTRQILPVIVALAIGLPIAIGGDAFSFMARYVFAPVVFIGLAAFVFALFVALVTPRR